MCPQAYNPAGRNWMHQPTFVSGESEREESHSKAEGSSSSRVKKPTTLASNLQQLAGNRAITSLVHLHHEQDPRLPAHTPAWSDRGQLHLVANALLLPRTKRNEILRHERIHQLQQVLAPADESHAARNRAESLAGVGEISATRLTLAQLTQPVPSVLAYPPQAFPPWNRVWVGYPGLVIEVVVGGVSVRVYKDYTDLGISPGSPQTYVCGTHDTPQIKDLAAKMKRAGQLADKRNSSLPRAAAAQRVALVVVSGKSSGFRTYNGQGIIVVNTEDFESSSLPTIEHEAAHSLFEFHSVAGAAGSTATRARVADALALQFADLYLKLSDTSLVPVPNKLFDARRPPALTVPPSNDPTKSADSGPANEEANALETKPAGLVMVMDTLWSGSGGHPWHGVDEFFASAYSGYLQNPELLKVSIRHYAAADPKIPPLAKSLIALVGLAGSPKKSASVRAPATKANAEKQLESVDAPLELSTLNELGLIEGRLNWVLDPSQMPGPSVIRCADKEPTAPASTSPSFEEFLEAK